MVSDYRASYLTMPSHLQIPAKQMWLDRVKLSPVSELQQDVLRVLSENLKESSDTKRATEDGNIVLDIALTGKF